MNSLFTFNLVVRSIFKHNTFIAALALFAITLSGHNLLAQPKVEVKAAQVEEDGQTYDGVATVIMLDEDLIDKALKKLLRDFGRLRTSKNTYYIEEAVIKDITEETVYLFATLEKSKKGVAVFISLRKNSTGYIREGQKEFDDLKKFLYEFAIARYRQDMNNQIKEAEDVVNKTVKDYEDLTSDGSDLQKDISENRERKAELEQELKDNAKDHEKLLEDIKDNKAEQEQALIEIEEVRKIAEEKRKELSKIK